MTPSQLAAADAMLAGFLETSSLTRNFWIPNGMIHQRSTTSDRYKFTRQPDRPLVIARLRPGTGRSSRMDLHMPSHVVSRLMFRKACTDQQLSSLSWSSAQRENMILSVSTRDGELGEALDAGRVVGLLHKNGTFEGARFHVTQ